ncbi:hypothetical protein [Streptomyces sp. NBC_00525]|uniref:hypothetical protein n=1 Tax=Streptomyces sp. NBC_00525 TaxID=2903660 RepID=UPI002E80EA0A|nr:hypothetical protein [Streptomyces sp. NBC_00525]WUC95381.1 hypothetical protein OG710_18115 [Streptomyces sp. NBC_00525]
MAAFDDILRLLGPPRFNWSDASGETVFFRIPERGGERWSVGVYESDEGAYHEYPMAFDEWMLSYLRPCLRTVEM